MPKIVDHDERRVAYVKALWRLVTREGAGAISVRNVAAEAGVSPSNLVHYLPSRADLLGAAVEQLIAIGANAISNVDLERFDLESAVDTLMAAIPDTPTRRRQSQVWLLLLAEQEASVEAKLTLAAMQRAVRAGVREGIDLLASREMLHPERDRETETDRLHALIDGVSLQTLIDHRSLPPARIRTMVRYHLADLATPPATS
jgi:AcrR family transcriptional regulator